jgi:hypothetical protein
MKRNCDDASEYREDLIMRLKTLFEFEVLVPEWVCEEVEADAFRGSLEESKRSMLVIPKGVLDAERVQTGQGESEHSNALSRWQAKAMAVAVANCGVIAGNDKKQSGVLGNARGNRS